MNTYDIVPFVARLKPGERIDMDLSYYRNAGCPGWGKADHVLENIAGSAYEFGYIDRFERGPDHVTFFRLERPVVEDTIRAYVSPDRRDEWTYDGMMWRRPERVFHTEYPAMPSWPKK